MADSVLRPLREGEVALSPGMRYRHYAPTGQLTLVTGEEKNVSALCKKLYDQAQSEGHNPYLLSFEEHLPLYQGRRVISIGQLTHPATVAARIFAVLRQMDDLHADVMLCEALAPTGVGLAIMNRLSRAAAFHTLSADEEQGR
ncbi:MAG: hypothetical protein EOM69_08395 [Clostridia bacterium]|nr:hypothetical protein [Clostridia bacterium]